MNKLNRRKAVISLGQVLKLIGKLNDPLEDETLAHANKVFEGQLSKLLVKINEGMFE